MGVVIAAAVVVVVVVVVAIVAVIVVVVAVNVERMLGCVVSYNMAFRKCSRQGFTRPPCATTHCSGSLSQDRTFLLCWLIPDFGAPAACQTSLAMIFL